MPKLPRTLDEGVALLESPLKTSPAPFYGSPSLLRSRTSLKRSSTSSTLTVVDPNDLGVKTISNSSIAPESESPKEYLESELCRIKHLLLKDRSVTRESRNAIVEIIVSDDVDKGVRIVTFSRVCQVLSANEELADKMILNLLINGPLARPGFDAINMVAPVMVQLNPSGKWENSPPAQLDEERLKTIVQHLVKSNAVSAAQSYCCQCAEESKKAAGGKSNYVPVIMMPIYPADECPFDIDCEVQKMKEAEIKPKKTKKSEGEKDLDKEKSAKKAKKRGFVMQRLTDFDLLSQW